MAEGITISSLRQALLDLETATDAHRVEIAGVHVAQATGLVALIEGLENGREARNLRRLRAVADLDGYFALVANGVLPALLREPSSTTALSLLDGYSSYIKSAASIVGGTFEVHAVKLCAALLTHVKAARRRPLGLTAEEELIRSTQEMKRRVGVFRSRHVTIADCDADDGSESDADADDDSDEDAEQLSASSLGVRGS